MSDASPPEPSAAPAPGPEPAGGPGPHKPRKVFLLVGIVVALVLGVFLFTGLGTNQNTSGAPHEGGPVPSFTAANVGPVGPHQVSVSAGGTGAPTVLLFFGNWCASCHQELPPLAAAVEHQRQAHGSLARVQVVGIDDLDSAGSAHSFIRSSGVTFPVAYDPNATITANIFKFDGNPYAVFLRSDGTIQRIVRGAVLTPASLSAGERALIPSGT